MIEYSFELASKYMHSAIPMDGTTNLAGFPLFLQAYPLAHYYIRRGQGRNPHLLFVVVVVVVGNLWTKPKKS